MSWKKLEERKMKDDLYPEHGDRPCINTGQFDAGECIDCRNERIAEAHRFYAQGRPNT